MKQRISVEDLQRLTDDQHERLREWWKPQQGDWYIFKYECEYWHEPSMIDQTDGYQKWMNEDGEDPIPLLSIGQMIQLIQEIGKYKFGSLEDVAYINIGYKGLGGSYVLDLIDLTEQRKIQLREFNVELCDLFWSAVKQVI